MYGTTRGPAPVIEASGQGVGPREYCMDHSHMRLLPPPLPSIGPCKGGILRKTARWIWKGHPLKPDLANFHLILSQSYIKSYASFAHQGSTQIR